MAYKKSDDFFNLISRESLAIGIERNIYYVMTTKKPDSIMMQSLGVSLVIYTIIEQERERYGYIEDKE